MGCKLKSNYSYWFNGVINSESGVNSLTPD